MSNPKSDIVLENRFVDFADKSWTFGCNYLNEFVLDMSLLIL